MENYLSTLSDIFHHNRNPMIIMDNSGGNCKLNSSCQELLSGNISLNIFEIFPDLVLNEKRQICHTKNTNEEIELQLKYSKKSRQWILEIESCDCSEWNEFVRFQKTLHIIFLELLAISNENLLYKTLVERVTKLLKIDRLGILLYDSSSDTVYGSWGTDKNGNIIEQTEYKEKLDKNSSVQEALALKDYVVIQDDVPLADSGVIIGRGWNATTAFFAGNKPIGFISCDNVLSKAPLPMWKKEILGELSRMTGELVFHLRIENHLKEQVENKTRELEETINRLRLTQENLIESEKLASLGSLVAGVSHEINTPIGVALTATSHLEEIAKELKTNFDNGNLKKNDLSNYLTNAIDGNNLATNSLKKAANLITCFKQLAIKDSDEETQNINIFDLINSAILSFQYSKNIERIEIKNSFDRDIFIDIHPMDLYQIITQLISNSLMHAFNKKSSGKITIKGSNRNSKLTIDYRDNGEGIPKTLQKKVFDPFFTTKRSGGGTGLGLSIIYNQVTKLGGTVKLTNNHPTGVKFLIKI